jgi:CBS domain-containing protein
MSNDHPEDGRATARARGGSHESAGHHEQDTFLLCGDGTLQRAAQLMKEHDVGAIPVVNDCNERKLLGIITDRDICMKVVAQGNLTSTAKVSEAMTSAPATCRPNESIEGCESLMKRHQVRRIPVMDSSGVCVGIVSQADIALRDTPEHIKDTLAAVSQHRARPQGQAVAARA